MINISTSFVASAENIRPVHRSRLGPNSFWLLFVVESLVLAAALLAILRVLPTAQPTAVAPDYGLVREAVLERTNGGVVDPLIEVAPGLFGPASNVRGFALNDVTYYYYFEGLENFDPLSRNRVSVDRVQIVLRDDVATHPLVIYTLAQ